MPYVLVFNRAAIEAKIERLAAYLGLEPSFDAFLAWVLKLREDLQCRTRWRASASMTPSSP